MTDPKVLAKYGGTPERLRAIFTSGDPGEAPADLTADDLKDQYEKKKTNIAIRRRFEQRIRTNLIEGIGSNLSNAKAIQAVDIALDAPPIQKTTIPLMLWARGKITTTDFCEQILGCCDQDPTTAKKFFTKDPKTDKINVHVPKISEITIDLVRSYVTRRLAAQDALWSNQWPLYRYDPRGIEPVSQLRGDVLTQRVDIISDSYNYRHQDSQSRRKMLAYGYSLLIPEGPWDRQISWRFKRDGDGNPTTDTEPYTEREGVRFVNPHPTRIGYDMSAPLADINTDTGPKWLFYWDIKRFGDICANDQYYNTKDIFTSSSWVGMLGTYAGYFSYYFAGNPCVMKFPEMEGSDPSLINDRTIQIGRYSPTMSQAGCLLSTHFFKINPKREGICDYDCECWLRLVVAGDCTVIWSEWMPSHVGAYGAVNWDDGRVANQSTAMALLGYQDQASMIMTQLIQQLRASMIQLTLIESDSLEESVREELKRNMENADYWINPVTIIYSASKLSNMGIQNPSESFKIIQSQLTNVFENALRALNQLLDLADRLLILSPNELGQPNPREVSALETQTIGGSVQAMNSFVSQGPREQVASKKEIIYDSLICHGGESFRVPVENRYDRETIKRAGFTVPEDAELGMGGDSQLYPVKTPVMGNLRNLVYDYYFDSRDGSERVVDTQGAQVMTQLLTAMLQIPPLAQAIGTQGIVDTANQIIRLSGAPWPFQIKLPVGPESSMVDQQAVQQQQAAQQGQQQGQAQMQAMGAQIQQLSAAVNQILGLISGRGGGVPPAPAPAARQGIAALAA